MSISILLDRLNDPFELFPLQQIERRIDEEINRSSESISERHGWWGVAEKYYPVETEHDYEVIENLIGAAFVLGQCSITRAVAICKTIRKDSRCQAWIPEGRESIMELAAACEISTQTSEITLIDVIANYFKHHREWPDDWDTTVANKQQGKTICRVVMLGLRPDSRYNMQNALRSLDLSVCDENSVTNKVGEWRENLCDFIRHEAVSRGIF